MGRVIVVVGGRPRYAIEFVFCLMMHCPARSSTNVMSSSFACYVCRVQAITGAFVLSCGSKGAGPGQFSGLRGLSLTPDETHLLVCDRGNQRVVVADARDGRSLRSLQGPAGTLDAPFQAIVGPQTGQVLVVDGDRCLVVVFAGVDDDTVVRRLGDGQGSGPRQLQNPCGLAVLDGDVADAAALDGPVAVVADTGNHRLALWRVRDGTVVRHVGSRGGDRRGVVGGGRLGQSSRASVDPHRDVGARAARRFGHQTRELAAWRDGVHRDGGGAGDGLAQPLCGVVAAVGWWRVARGVRWCARVGAGAAFVSYGRGGIW